MNPVHPTNPHDNQANSIVGIDGKLVIPDATANNKDYEFYIEAATDDRPPVNTTPHPERKRMLIIFVGIFLCCIPTLFIQQPPDLPLINIDGNFHPILPELDHTTITSIGANHRIRELFWSPNGTQLAILYNEGLSIWDFNLNRLLFQNPIKANAFSWLNGERFAVASENTISIYTTPNQSLIEQIQLSFRFWGSTGKMRWNEDKNWIAVIGDNESAIAIVDLTSKTILFEANRQIFYDIVWQPDSETLYVIGNVERETTLLQWQTGETQLQGAVRFETEKLRFVMDWSPDGQYLAITEAMRNGQESIPQLSIYRATDFQAIWQINLPYPHPLPAYIRIIDQVKWSPTDNRIATVPLEKNAIYIWEHPNTEPISTLHFDFPNGTMDWSPDGRYLAIVTSNNSLIIWQPQ
ncbi:MAG: WD40 repeat domain-containing protein [Anaerolineae bacterium]|nr:WD40 repeat domain-containing protein [Anaerolineae bacterium]